MLAKILLLLSFTLFPLSSGYESPSVSTPPTEMEEAINAISDADKFVLQFKEQTDSGEWTATALNGDYVAKAEVKTDEYYQVSISVTFTSEGSTLFEKITEKNIGKPLGIFINGELISVPIVNDKITGGEAIITGNFTKKEAEALAETLNRTINSKK